MGYKRNTAIALGALGGLAATVFAGTSARFELSRRRADRDWESAVYPKIEGLGEVERLSILPLIDWYTISDELIGEPGVSYLVKADDYTVLFDVGLNYLNEEPSPLLRNMDALGVAVADIDSVFISHFHVDHVGGFPKKMRGTFGLSGDPVDLGGIPAYVPVPMNHPTADCVLVEEPRILAPGVASIGTIPRQLYFMGWTPEQSLAVNVKDRGIVIIVGCGHQTLQRIVDRTEMLFDEPLYGVIGGLHYPVTGSRMEKLGVPVQKYIGTGKWPWKPVSPEDVETAISYLRNREPRLAALSAHDSCDWSIDAFRRAFKDSYRYILAGLEIPVA